MGSQGRAASAAAIRSAAWGRSWMSGRRIVVLDGNRRLRPRVTREYGHRVTRQMGGPQIGVDTPRTGSLLDSGRRRRACRYAWRPRSRPVRDQRRRRSPGGRSARQSCPRGRRCAGKESRWPCWWWLQGDPAGVPLGRCSATQGRTGSAPADTNLDCPALSPGSGRSCSRCCCRPPEDHDLALAHPGMLQMFVVVST